MNDKAIAIFDSGLGGLTCVKEIMRLLPHEDIVYFGDIGRLPYGSRSPQTLYKYVTQNIRFLKHFDIKMIAIACGTASTVVLPMMDTNEIGIPMTGVVSEAASAAVKQSKTGKIGVIATQATIHSGAFEKEIKKISPNAKVYSAACPLFVPLVENGHTDTEVSHIVAREYLQPLIEKNVDTLILGCTHYPLLAKTITDIMGSGVFLINSGEQMARYIKRYLTQNDMLTSKNEDGSCSYYVSDTVQGFEKLGSLFLGREIKGLVKQIDIEKY